MILSLSPKRANYGQFVACKENKQIQWTRRLCSKDIHLSQGTRHTAGICVWPDTKCSKRRRQDKSLHKFCSPCHPNSRNHTSRHDTILYSCNSALHYRVPDSIFLSLRDDFAHFLVFAFAICQIRSFCHVHSRKDRPVLLCITAHNVISAKIFQLSASTCSHGLPCTPLHNQSTMCCRAHIHAKIRT